MCRLLLYKMTPTKAFKYNKRLPCNTFNGVSITNFVDTFSFLIEILKA